MELVHSLVLPKLHSHFLTRPPIGGVATEAGEAGSAADGVGGAAETNGNGVKGNGVEGTKHGTKHDGQLRPPPYTVEVAGYDRFP
jgi:hypothetical protein